MSGTEDSEGEEVAAGRPGLLSPRGALPAIPADRVASLQRLSWSLSGVEDDGRRLAITVSGTSKVISGVHVTQTSSTVTVDVYGPLMSDLPVTASRISSARFVELPDALDGRRLLGATD